MSTVTDMLDDFVEGRVPLSKTMLKFENFKWAKPAELGDDVGDGVPPVENSFDEVGLDSRLTSRQYTQLAQAYRRAQGG